MADDNPVAAFREQLWTMFRQVIDREDFDRDEIELAMAELGFNLDDVVVALLDRDFDKVNALLADAKEQLESDERGTTPGA